MYATQYEISLPADYDMGIIRKRVADRGHALDDRAGLGLKAYLVRESPNQYAPFYLWRDTGRMAEFLAGGGGFHNIVRDFGRPVVRHWTGLAFERGPVFDAVPRRASRLITPIPDGDPASAVEEALAGASVIARESGVHSVALALDPHHWQLARFILGEDDGEATERYEVLHLSVPELAAVRVGRQW
ncbi:MULTISPECIES: DUF4865 family protein [Amycolatopsis]|uniref:DUF4865 family protein n=1 Tax=Amycolatopsis thermalba TaxID=944492 RepID=A0ABY4P2S2_9PSEU|nr:MULTISPECIES: DUF4865 family protein [Amycolatopsis]OXM73614.1 DUF4865 domain-containing protein [Amycolatopsis sp. KNN50.9b]UQS26571.1 DUF4865 family protein [Amycolatopsis thermalba]